MKIFNIIKIIVTLIFTFVLIGCNTINSGEDFKAENTEFYLTDFPYDKGVDYLSDNNELNIGNSSKFAVDGNFIYYSDVNDNYKLYRIDKNLKVKLKIYDGEVSGIIISNDNIYFTERTWKDSGSPEFKLCSIDKEGNSYNVILNGVKSCAFLNGKLFYYKDSGETSGEPNQYPLALFCNYDLINKKEQIIDEKIILEQLAVVYNNKIYYCGSEDRFIEYNPETSEKNEINMIINYFYRFYKGNIYSYKGNIIEKTNIADNTKITVLSGIDEIYNIWDMNVTKNYIFFLAQETEENNNGINRLHLFRMKHDGSELTKIYTTDYTTDFVSNMQLIFCLGDKLVLYDYDMREHIVNRNLLQVIDFNGKKIESEF